MTIPHLSPILDEKTIAAIADAVETRRGPKTNGSMRADVVKVVLQLVVAALVAYGTVNVRITVLEARYEDLRTLVNEVRGDVKTLLQRTP